MASRIREKSKCIGLNETSILPYEILEMGKERREHEVREKKYLYFYKIVF